MFLKRYISISASPLLLLFLVTTCNIYATEFQIDRGKVRMRIPPGWSDGGTIKVTNKGNDSILIKCYLQDWVYTDFDGSKDFMPPGTHKNSAVEWIKFYPTNFTIAPKAEKNVNYVVAIPLEAKGGHYAVLFFETQIGEQLDKEKGTTVNVFNRIGTLFYIEPEGTTKREANLTDFTINNQSSEGVEVMINFENVSDVDITAKGTFDIIDEDGFVFARGQFNEAYTMPQDKAHLYAKSSNQKLIKGRYDVILTIDLEETVLVKDFQIEVSDLGQIISIKEVE